MTDWDRLRQRHSGVSSDINRTLRCLSEKFLTSFSISEQSSGDKCIIPDTRHNSPYILKKFLGNRFYGCVLSGNQWNIR